MARIVAAALRNQDPDSSLGKALYHLRGKLEEFMKYGRTLGPEGHKAVQKLKQNGFSNSVIAIVGFSRIMTHYGAACIAWPVQILIALLGAGITVLVTYSWIILSHQFLVQTSLNTLSFVTVGVLALPLFYLTGVLLLMTVAPLLYFKRMKEILEA